MVTWKRLAFLLCWLACPLLVWSQTGLTSLRGTVTDSSGAVLAGAEVSLENPSTGFHVVHTTDQSGAYEFPQIPPGDFTITLTKAGRQRAKAGLCLHWRAAIDVGFRGRVSCQHNQFQRG